MMLLIGLTLALSDCRPATLGCPPLVTYPKSFQQQAARELRSLPNPSAVGEMIVDYGKTRDSLREVGCK